MQISSRFARRILPRPKRVWRTAAILVRSGFYPDPGYLEGFELTKNARFREIRAELAVDCRDLSGNRDKNISPPQKKLPGAKSTDKIIHPSLASVPYLTFTSPVEFQLIRVPVYVCTETFFGGLQRTFDWPNAP